jgi:hypothetical protein
MCVLCAMRVCVDEYQMCCMYYVCVMSIRFVLCVMIRLKLSLMYDQSCAKYEVNGTRCNQLYFPV